MYVRGCLCLQPVNVIEHAGDGDAIASGDGAGIGEELGAAAAVAAERFERLVDA